VMHWNARGIRANLNHFKHYIQQHNPDIICLQETKLQPTITFNIPGYTIIREDRPTYHTSGGLAILIKTTLNYQGLTVSAPPVESLAISVHCNNTSITIVNIYCPHEEVITAQILNNLLTNIPTQSYLLCGDWNAHNPGWGSNKFNTYGRAVEDWCDNHNLIVLNPPLPTRINITNGNTSIIDLSITSPTLAPLTDTNPDNSTTIGSDHYPVHTN
jgi:endonuclease/exonuclease/phosphatase family metal-dependent hydrolase